MFAIPIRSAVQSNLTAWCDHKLTNLAEYSLDTSDIWRPVWGGCCFDRQTRCRSGVWLIIVSAYRPLSAYRRHYSLCTFGRCRSADGV